MASSTVIRGLFWCLVIVGVVVADHALRDLQSGPPQLHDAPFVLAEREATNQLTVTPATPLILPYAFGDCDVLATVEVPAAGELDLVVRRIEPAQGHGRFGVLRLSADQAGPAFRSRDEALFGAARGGVKVAAGVPASLRIELRGNRIFANVAGSTLEPFEVADDRGDLAFVARGGTAVVAYLQVLPVERPPLWRRPQPFLWGGAMLVWSLLAIAGGRSRARWRAYLAVASVPALAWLLHAVVARELVAASTVSATGIAVAVGALLAGGCLLLVGSRALWPLRLLLLLMVLVAGLETFARVERARLRVAEDPRLDLHFGADSRQAPFDALAKLLHGKNEVHAIEAPRPGEPARERVMFLGGEPLFEANLDRAHHLGVQATALAAQTTRRALYPAVVPTAFPHTQQQIELFTRFYADAYPAVAVVLGIDCWDAQRDGETSARERLTATAAGVPEPWSWAWAMLRPRAAAVALASPEDLAATLDAFAGWCAGRRLPLLLATHARLPAAHLQVVDRVARQRQVPCVVNAMDLAERADVTALGDALAAALRR
jgi:hypothetical protein